MSWERWQLVTVGKQRLSLTTVLTMVTLLFEKTVYCEQATSGTSIQDRMRAPPLDCKRAASQDFSSIRQNERCSSSSQETEHQCGKRGDAAHSVVGCPICNMASRYF